jgi:Uncharacterized protein conserved in bacteria
MRLLYDLDGNLVHFDRGYDLIMNTDYIHLTDIPRSHEQTSFNLWDGRTPEEQEAIREVMNRPGFYRDLDPIDGAVDAVKEAVALGHEVHFLSAPWTTNPTCAQDKYDWIGKHFGDDWRDRLILAKDKTIVSGDILFDDKYPILKKERADWTQVFFDQPYNRNAEGLRITSWQTDEWKNIIELVAERKREAGARADELSWAGSAPW